MDAWLHNLPLAGMVGVVFGFTYLCAALISGAVRGLTALGRGAAFQGVSPGILSPLGTILGLFIAFVSLQVWENERNAIGAVMREASALRSAVIVSRNFPGAPEAKLRGFVAEHINAAVAEEWPAMARQTARLGLTPQSLVGAMDAALALQPVTPGQQIAQRQLVSDLESALEARRQRIILSQARVDFLKWACLYTLAFCAFAVIAMVHTTNRGAGRAALGVFATGVATAVLLILAYDEPFTGDTAVPPAPLLQVLPEGER